MVCFDDVWYLVIFILLIPEHHLHSHLDPVSHVELIDGHIPHLDPVVFLAAMSVFRWAFRKDPRRWRSNEYARGHLGSPVTWHSALPASPSFFRGQWRATQGLEVRRGKGWWKEECVQGARHHLFHKKHATSPLQAHGRWLHTKRSPSYTRDHDHNEPMLHGTRTGANDGPRQTIVKQSVVDNMRCSVCEGYVLSKRKVAPPLDNRRPSRRAQQV